MRRLWRLLTSLRGLARRVGWRCKRIVRPGMARIAAAHLGLHGRIAAAPEIRQVACHLHRAMGRRQQFDDQRHAAAGNRRMAIEAEQFLHADRELRAFLGLVLDRHAANRTAPRNGSALRRFEPAAQRIRQQGVQRRFEVRPAASVAERRLVGEQRRQPFLGRRRESLRPRGPATPRPRRGAGTARGRAIAGAPWSRAAGRGPPR